MSEAVEEGVTAFAPPPAPTYRFVITSQTEKVKISLEDLKSKKQWSTGFLDEKEYVTSTNSIPEATLSDYLKLIKDALEYLMDQYCPEQEDDNYDNDASGDVDQKASDGDDDEDADEKSDEPSGEANQERSELDPAKIRRKLTPIENDALELELRVKIRIFRSAWTVKYVFRLESVSLDRVDILEAKLRDVQEELEATKKSLAEEKAKQVVHLSASFEGLKDTEKLVWGQVKDFFALVEAGTGICFAITGWYIVCLKVHLTPAQSSCNIDLNQNEVRIASDTVPILQQKQSCTGSITCTAYFEMDDVVSVVVEGSPSDVEADLTATRIGESTGVCAL